MLIIDNFLGVIISKKDLSLKHCFVGTEQNFLLERGNVLEIPNDEVK